MFLRGSRPRRASEEGRAPLIVARSVARSRFGCCRAGSATSWHASGLSARRLLLGGYWRGDRLLPRRSLRRARRVRRTAALGGAVRGSSLRARRATRQPRLPRLRVGGARGGPPPSCLRGSRAGPNLRSSPSTRSSFRRGVSGSIPAPLRLPRAPEAMRTSAQHVGEGGDEASKLGVKRVVCDLRVRGVVVQLYA
jgi:hypothetical protein